MGNNRLVVFSGKYAAIIPILAIVSIILYSLIPVYAAIADSYTNTKINISQDKTADLTISKSYVPQLMVLIQENAILSQNSAETMNTARKEKSQTVVNDKIMAVMAEEPRLAIKKTVIVTAYSSTVDQTDSTPFITANGTHVHDGTVAANFLKFGTKVKFPSLYGDKIFIVEDRMKSDIKMDIWFPSRQEALNFGVKRVEVEILQ